MRWTTYRPKDSADQADRVGIVEGDTIFALPVGTRLIDLLGDDGTRLREAGEKAKKSPSETRPLSQAKLLSPIPQPPTMRDFVSFEDHHRTGIEAVGQKWDDAYYDLPMFYFTNAANLTGDDVDINFPGYSKKMDYELEIGAIIGREGQDIDPADAEKYIAGYCIFNDWSARDIQGDEMARAPIGPAKGKDFGFSAGPFMVTPDEIADRRKGNGYDLYMRAYINGKLYSDSNWAKIYWSWGEMVAYASRNTKIKVGDVLGSGTVSTGCILELSTTQGVDKYPWLKAGDEVVLEIERLGKLKNTIRVTPPPIPIRGVVAGRRVAR